MTHTAVILAGGRGTRIAHLAKDTPKPLISIGGRPFLHWLMKYLARQGVSRFVLSAGHLAPAMEAFAEAERAAGADVAVVVEQEPLGTGGAVSACLPHVGDWFLALNGDSIVVADLAPLLALAGAPGLSGALLGVHVDDTSRFGSLNVDAEGHLAGFHEKRPGTGLINGGVYLFRRDAIGSVREPGFVSMEHQTLPRLIREGHRLKVVDCGPASFIDIGTPETLGLAEAFVAAHRQALDI